MKKQVDFEDFQALAHCFVSLMEGDTHNIDTGYAIMKQYGLDEYGNLPEDEEETYIPPKPKKAVD